MANDFALIPCEVCGNLFTIDEYMSHASTHQVKYDYNQGDMYGPEQGGHGPLPKPPSYTHQNQQTVTPDYNTGDMYGGSTANKDSNGDSKQDDNSMDDEKKNAIQDLNEQSANALRDTGCCIIKQGVRKDLAQNALRLINHSLSKAPDLIATDEYRKHNDMLDLFNESAAFSLCQNILGLSNVLIPKTADIKLSFPAPLDDAPPQTESVSSMSKWTMDGLDDEKSECVAPYSLAMRMVLSAQKFKYFKASHVTVFEMMRKDGMQAFMQHNQKETERKELDAEKNTLEAVEVDTGDIVIYHPFLCVPVDERNETENIEYRVEFKVNHKNFNAEVAAKRAQHLWLGYEQLKDALNGEVLKI
eukprot:CAMPEP_0197035520 /NCGR_PEP_ID=MMETSP1384-20130603/13294_1 /TAXON_ID=29189 /ORGANISM="Ammonia sp." /LENGTH=358 /DNA_ID=CAMNT_0042465591 /DNA_START=22 /DNA_END=1098 /DNA_ORIENTATION=+